MTKLDASRIQTT